MFWWLLVQHDGTQLRIKPQAVDAINKCIAEKKPIKTSTMTIPANQVKSFRITGDKYMGNPQPLIEAVAQAFNQPQLTEDGSVKARWVKKEVPQDQYNRYYAPIGYRRLKDGGGMTTMAYRLPVHLVDVNQHDYCTVSEIGQLERA